VSRLTRLGLAGYTSDIAPFSVARDLIALPSVDRVTLKGIFSGPAAFKLILLVPALRALDLVNVNILYNDSDSSDLRLPVGPRAHIKKLLALPVSPAIAEFFLDEHSPVDLSGMQCVEIYGPDSAALAFLPARRTIQELWLGTGTYRESINSAPYQL
jgi:hypothetical protein